MTCCLPRVWGGPHGFPSRTGISAVAEPTVRCETRGEKVGLHASSLPQAALLGDSGACKRASLLFWETQGGGNAPVQAAGPAQSPLD